MTLGVPETITVTVGNDDTCDDSDSSYFQDEGECNTSMSKRYDADLSCDCRFFGKFFGKFGIVHRLNGPMEILRFYSYLCLLYSFRCHGLHIYSCQAVC